MKKKKHTPPGFDPEILKMYMMGAANPVQGNKINYAVDVIDLHLDRRQVGQGKIPPSDALFHQLAEFEKAFDKAIASGRLEFRVVHGHGKGKLKQEIHKLLDKHPNVRSYENSYHSQYGFGSTLIYIK